MKTKLLGIALFGLTLAAIVYYPQLSAKSVQIDPSIDHHVTAIRRSTSCSFWIRPAA
jgi:hypothetical protein